MGIGEFEDAPRSCDSYLDAVRLPWFKEQQHFDRRSIGSHNQEDMLALIACPRYEPCDPCVRY